MAKALVLNATYEPLCVVPVRRAVILVLKEKAEVLHATDQELHSERATFAVPSVIRLMYFVKVPFRARAALNRRAVFARDGHRCLPYPLIPGLRRTRQSRPRRIGRR